MMKKIIFLLAVIMAMDISFAQTINLDEKNIIDNLIVQNNATYKILYRTQTFFADGSIYKKIVVENLTRIEELKGEIPELYLEIDMLDNKISELENATAGLEEMKNNNYKIAESLKEQKEYYKILLSSLENEKSELENRMTGNLVVTPTNYKIGIVVFFVLLAAVVIIKGSSILKKERAK